VDVPETVVNAPFRIDWKRQGEFYVYALFHPISGEPCYIGKGSGRRWRDQATKPRNPILRNLIAKFGAPLPCVKVRQLLTEEQAFEIEKLLISIIGRKKNGGSLANMTDGGDGVSGMRHSAEYRRRLSIENTGKKWGPDFKAKVRAGWTPEIRAAAAAKLRKPKTPEHRERIRLANLGKKRSPEACDAMRRARLAFLARQNAASV
jgi:hypothetical protein